MDCGDNSCMFAKERTGMRTNGGCRCLEKFEVYDENEKRWNRHELRELREYIMGLRVERDKALADANELRCELQLVYEQDSQVARASSQLINDMGETILTLKKQRDDALRMVEQNLRTLEHNLHKEKLR